MNWLLNQFSWFNKTKRTLIWKHRNSIWDDCLCTQVQVWKFSLQFNSLYRSGYKERKIIDHKNHNQNYIKSTNKFYLKWLFICSNYSIKIIFVIWFTKIILVLCWKTWNIHTKIYIKSKNNQSQFINSIFSTMIQLQKNIYILENIKIQLGKCHTTLNNSLTRSKNLNNLLMNIQGGDEVWNKQKTFFDSDTFII